MTPEEGWISKKDWMEVGDKLFLKWVFSKSFA
jgi:hypothetical protein